MPRMTGKRAMIEQLLADGVRHVFGNPGTTEQGFMDALGDYPQIEFMLALHEGVAVCMADAFARITRRPAFTRSWVPFHWSDSIRATYRVPFDYAGPDPIVNTATVTAGNGDPVPGNNTASGTTPLVADTTRLRFYTVSPCRLVDTRDAARGGPLPLSPGPAHYTAGAGACGVPYAARALAVNVTATEPTAAGYLKLYPDDATPPLASFVNYQAGQTRSNNGVIGLDASSRFVVEVGQAGGAVHLIVDVVGYFQ